MMKAVAFVRNVESLSAALQYAEAVGIQHILFVSEEALKAQYVGIVTAEYANISQFQPNNLDWLVLREIDRRYDEWMKANIRLRSRMENAKIGSAVKMSFEAIVFQYFRRVMLTDIVIVKLGFKKVITDQYWSFFLHLDHHDDIEFKILRENQNKYIKDPSVKDTIKETFSFLRYAVLTLLGGIILPVLFGKIVNAFSKQSPYNSEIILLGADQGNRSFKPVWQRIITGFGSHAELKFAEVSLLKIQDDIKKGRFWADGLVSMESIPGVASEFINMTLSFYKAKKKFPILNNRTKCSAEIEFASDFSINIDYFFLRSFAKALLFGRLSSYIAKQNSLRMVIFTSLSSASRAFSQALQINGIKTVTTTHGMVFEPIAYRSEDSIKLTWGAFDADLLAGYSLDGCFMGLPINPEAFKDEGGNSFSSWSSIKTYVPKNTQLSNCESMKLCSNEESGRIAIIFPSTNQHGPTLKRFLRICLNYLLKFRSKHHFDSIIIKPKKHPRTKIQEFERVLSEILPEHPDVPVFLTWDIEINRALQLSTFALCAHSSIMLDCIRHGVPFAVYTYGSISNKAFLERLPDWMKFEDEEKLHTITKDNLITFDATSKGLMEDYWGKNNDYNEVLCSLISIAKEGKRI